MAKDILRKENKPTHYEVRRGNVAERTGWCFEVSYNKEQYANLISALYKTHKEATAQLERYLETGEFDFYGSAEK